MGKSTYQPPIAATILEALRRLEAARHAASLAGVDPWEHAVRVDDLLADGLSQEHLTWLDQIGWIELGYEVSSQTARRRVFAKSLRTVGDVTWCAILTPAGLVAARNCPAPTNGVESNGRSLNGHEPKPATHSISNSNGHANGAMRPRSKSRRRRPKWDARTRVLRLGRIVVKRYRGHAPNQIRILDAFQEENWARAIDDPLPPAVDGDARRRLSDTIKVLNRHQVNEVLKFHSNGTGEVVTWELVHAHEGERNGIAT